MNTAVEPAAVRLIRIGKLWIVVAGLALLSLGVAGFYYFSAAPIDQVEALATLRAQSEECCQAMVNDNHAMLVDRSLPYLVEMMGGREKYIRRLESMASEMKGSGVYSREITVSEPTDYHLNSSILYSVVPYKLLLKGPFFLTRTVSGQLIGVSRDRGKNWSFFDCTRLKGDRAKIKQVVPGFPDEMPLPSNEPNG